MRNSGSLGHKKNPHGPVRLRGSRCSIVFAAVPLPYSAVALQVGFRQVDRKVQLPGQPQSIKLPVLIQTGGRVAHSGVGNMAEPPMACLEHIEPEQPVRTVTVPKT